jgi:predicted permease
MAAFGRLLDEVRVAPGVRAAALSSQPPLGGGGMNGLLPEGRAPEPRNLILSRSQFVTPGYFQAMRIPLRAGRAFTAEDRRGAPKVMIVSESFARTAWPGLPALGKRVSCCEGGLANPDYKVVVGVAADVHTRGPAVEPGPEFYLPLDQVPAGAWGWIQQRLSLLVRTDGSPAALAPAVRRAARAVDAALPVYDVMPMEERLLGSFAPARFNAALLAALAVLGLLLAALGLYGVVACLVSQRTCEIGVRVALGARGSDVVWLVLRQSLGVTLAGVSLGLLAALALGRLLESLLFGVGARDPWALACAAALLVVATTAAALPPSLRATRIAPSEAINPR